MEAPLLTLDSGPVSGVSGSLYLGRLMGCRNIITTDMGGTSFDVGVIFEGQPAYLVRELDVNQYEYFMPAGRPAGDRLRRRQPGAHRRDHPHHAGRPGERRRRSGAGLLRQGGNSRRR